MLILSRKVGQSIVISDVIEITITEVKGDQVRIGINAPREVTIRRKEVLAQVREQNIQAASTSEVSMEVLNELIQGSSESDNK